MRNPGRLDDADRCRSEAWADTVEQASIAAEQDRDDVQLDLIDEPGGQVLIDHIGATADDHVPATGGLSCLRGYRLDPVGNEVNVVSDSVSGSRS